MNGRRGLARLGALTALALLSSPALAQHGHHDAPAPRREEPAARRRVPDEPAFDRTPAPASWSSTSS